VRWNIFNFVISLLELHCIRILWSYTQISGHKLISIRIGRALLKINVIFVQQIYILIIQILIFDFLSHSLSSALATINTLHWSLFSTKRSIFGFLRWPFLIICVLQISRYHIRFFLHQRFWAIFINFRNGQLIIWANVVARVEAKWLFFQICILKLLIGKFWLVNFTLSLLVNIHCHIFIWICIVILDRLFCDILLVSQRYWCH
jgi:hypothetical protein